MDRQARGDLASKLRSGHLVNGSKSEGLSRYPEFVCSIRFFQRTV